MNYHHAFHAGNFADVFKHAVLVHLLESLNRKDSPWCYIDTHAGAGRYDLTSVEAHATGEWQNGIAALPMSPTGTPVLAPYLRLVAQGNADTGLRFYPGSPQLAQHLARGQDRLILNEPQAPELMALRHHFGHDPRIHIHQRDGYELLRALLPPKERRGLMLIDPPYESAQEFQMLARALHQVRIVWPQGILMAWYPLTLRNPASPLHHQLLNSGMRKILLAEFRLTASAGSGLYGCGLILINPPWRSDEWLKALIAELQAHFQPGRSVGHLEWLVPE